MHQPLFALLPVTLSQRDFQRFYSSFRDRAQQAIPGMGNLFFLFGEEDIPRDVLDSESLCEILAFFADPIGKGQVFHAGVECIVVTLSVKEGEILVLATDVDNYFCKNVSNEWLQDLAEKLENSFIHIKSEGVDFLTNLLNGRQFLLHLSQLIKESCGAVLLVEVYPRARSSWEAGRHKKKTVRSLNAILPLSTSLCYLGDHVYGILLKRDGEREAKKIARRIMVRLRRDGLRRIHIGMCWLPFKASEADETEWQSVYNQAEYALQKARGRGPFAICDFERLRHPENHPLKKPSKRILAKFRRRYREIDVFSIALFSDSAKDKLEEVRNAAGSTEIVSDGEDVYAFFPDSLPEDAIDRARKIVISAGLENVRIGVACYPYAHFSKNQVIFNCRKALRHAEFFGPAGKATFNALSLNISGDIYYGEGDLASAVKEYRAGLLCEPNDVNLLNSLGVAYADMNRHKDAATCFDEVLAIDPFNFMALYNAGLGAELRGKNTDSIDYFERAVSLETDFSEAKNDLAFHLGRLHCSSGNYARALELLLPWYEQGGDDLSRGKALHFIGKTYHGLKKYEKASVWLQKALQYDEFDGEAMVLLGHGYLLCGQGNEVALSLCRRGVELAVENMQLRLYLAEAEIACRLHDQARETLKTCLRRKQTRIRAQLLALLNYRKEKNWPRVRSYIYKLRKNSNLENDIVRQLADIEGEINGI